nr:MAG TPA: L SHAPED TAIL FIBER PROTEIN [Caudoviricetes sp.]
MSQLDIKIRKLQDNGSTFRANIETLYLGGVRSAKVDELRFELPEEWKNCTVTLHVQRLSGTKPDPQILDENNSVLVDRRWTLEKEGTWMLLAINDSGYIAMTKPGKYTCYDTIDTDTTTENITPSIYEQFVAEVTKYAKQALESMNAAKTSETNAKTSETNAKASADKAKASADSMDTSVATCTTKAKEAEASAVRAKTSETNAKTSETNAKASENAAKTSETNAKASADAAKSSETKSAASETAAKASETAAKRALQDTETEHTAALQNIAQARTAALNDVAASTKTATAAANTATQQATDAAGSASTAATKAGEASTSAGAAATSRQAAEKAQKAAEDAAALAGTRAGTDKTLSVPDAPADAKTVGDKFKSIKTDWNSVTDKPSTFPPSAHNHSKLEFENKNEVNFVGIPENNTVYLGYRDNTIDEYRFNDGRGSGSFANVRANKFIGSLDGNATTATKATGVTDYKDASRTIQVGYAGDGLNTSNLTHIAGYTDNGTKIKDVNKSVMQSWLGVTTITSQTSDPGSGSSLATGSILLVYA